MWFKRNWELIDKTILPSGFQQLKEAGATTFKSELGLSFFSSTVVLTFKCSITGRVKTTTVSS